MSFAEGVRLERKGEGRFGIDIDPRWRVFLGPNGGYLTALMLQAQSMSLPDGDRIARLVAVHFPSRAVEGEVEISVSVEREGRSFTSTTAQMFQEGRLCATSHATFALPRGGDSYDEIGAPDVPKPEDVEELVIPDGMRPPFSENFEYRPCLGSMAFSGAERAEVGGWIRPVEEHAIDTVLLAAYADAFIPSVFTRVTEPIPAPTIDLTVHFLGDDFPRDPDWVLCRFETPVARDGLSIEDGWMWSRDGALLARSRQLALFR